MSIKMHGRVINGGAVRGQAVMLDMPFSFIGDFDPESGRLTLHNHQMNGESIANKILVCTTGKGGTIAPFIAYQAKQRGKAPAAILCNRGEPILCESAIAIDIPILDAFDVDIVACIKTGQLVIVENDEVSVCE